MNYFFRAFVHIKNSHANRKDATSHCSFIFFCYLALIFPRLGVAIPPIISPQQLPYPPQIIARIVQGQIYVSSQVQSWEQKQTMTFSIAGKHSRTCQFALRKLSRYQDYSQFLDVVQASSYNEQNQEAFFALSSHLLPFNMSLTFKIAPMKAPGVYPFKFEKGFLSGLVGNIHVIASENHCYFYAMADWLGPSSGISDQILAFFTKALGQLVMENLFRISALP